MAKVSVFLDAETHKDLKILAMERKTSLTRLIEHICQIYRKDLARRKTAAA